MCDYYMTLAVAQHSTLCQSMLGRILNTKLNSIYKVRNLASFVGNRKSCNSPVRTDEIHEGASVRLVGIAAEIRNGHPSE
jgi:hypothetical protein